jgi:phage gpG-like protein
MAIKTEVRFSLKGLETLTREAKAYRARVGILGAKVDRTGLSFSNSEIGLVHIMGSYTRNIPARDFLLFPIEFNKEKILRKMNSEKVRKFVESGEWAKVFKVLGAIAEIFVQEAFETGGFGQWPALAESTIEKKGSDTILIETAQLRNSITSDVKKKGEL